MGFPRQEYWSELPFPSPQDHPNPGTEPASPTLQADTLPILNAKSKSSLEGICHKFQNPSMDFQMMVVTLITHRLYERVIFFHTTKPFSWFFSYSQSKGSWRPLGLQPTAKMRPHSHLGQGLRTTPLGVGREVCHHQSQLPEEGAGTRGKEWLVLGCEFCSALLGQAHAATWFPLQHQRTETCPLRHPGGRLKLRPCVLGVRRMFPAYHSYRNICAQQFPAELLWKFTVFDCFQNFSLLSLRQGGLKAASELLQEVREITVSRVWMKCGIRVWEVSLEPCVLQTSIDWSILPSLLIQSTYTCWAWCELTLRWIKIWVRVGLQRANNLVRSNQWSKMIQIIKYYLFGNQETPMKWQPCIIYIYIYTKGKQSYWFCKYHLE